MLRFVLFGYDDYYPSGGAHDILGWFDTEEELRRWADLHAQSAGRLADDRYQAYDCHEQRVTSVATVVNKPPGQPLEWKPPNY